MSAKTPIIDAAVRAGCGAITCNWPKCRRLIACRAGLACPVMRALCAVFPRDPTPETVEALDESLIAFDDPLRWASRSDAALAAYRAHPLWQELWRDEP